jgi:hypothetical protein
VQPNSVHQDQSFFQKVRIRFYEVGSLGLKIGRYSLAAIDEGIRSAEID